MPKSPNPKRFLQIYTPAVLPLAMAKVAHGNGEQTAGLGVALQHPRVDLVLHAALTATANGPRADVAAHHMQQLYQSWPDAPPANVEIELAIPSTLGLGSESMLGLGIAKGLARLAGANEEEAALARALGFGPQQALEMHCAHGGGLLLAGVEDANAVTAAPLAQAAIAHSDDDAWGFVLVQPRAQGAMVDEADTTRLQRAIQAGTKLDSSSGQLVQDVLFPAVAADDLDAFGAGLTTLQEMNQVAMIQAGLSVEQPANAQAIFDVMRQTGAVACGQSAAGLALFALTRGARATINMRAALRSVVPHNAGYMFATIVDNHGLRVIEKSK